MSANNLKNVIEQVGKDEGIDKKILVEALEAAMVTVAKKKFGYKKELEAHFNERTGEIEIHQFRTVADTITDAENEVSVDEARKLDPECAVGDSIGSKIDMQEFGRIAAQTAKQVIMQKVRDAKRDIVYNEFIHRKAEILTGIVRKYERGDLYIDLGRAEAIMPRREQLPGETYKPGARIQGVILEVHKISKGPQIILSRSHESYLIKLFEMEVPEIYEGIVKIYAAAREPGGRAKIAVYSKDSDVDPVGACVGMKGSRVQSVVANLRGEKIDIVPYDPDSVKFVCNAIAPAEISRIRMNEAERTMELIVNDDQLSLAIGKKGQNVRLASKLTGWKLDIVSESELMKRSHAEKMLLKDVPFVGDANAEVIKNTGTETAEDFLALTPEKMGQIPGFNPKDLDQMRGLVDYYIKLQGRTLEKLRAMVGEQNLDQITQNDLGLLRIKGVGIKWIKLLNQHKLYRVDTRSMPELEKEVSKINVSEDLQAQFLLNTKLYLDKLGQLRDAEDKTSVSLEMFDSDIEDLSLDQALEAPKAEAPKPMAQEATPDQPVS